ncbi:MAG: hypothetical protein PHP93_03385 [Kiritimatiellales bacterium]|nr:hypothetical protein [Kiritimatiellales bacterium]
MNRLPTFSAPEITGIANGSRDFRDLSSEQKAVAEEMIRDAELRDLYSAIALVAKTASRTGALLGGIESDDLIFDHNPATGRTQISIDRARMDETKKPTDLGEATKEFMVYQRLANDPDTGAPQYGFDYVRVVIGNEE